MPNSAICVIYWFIYCFFVHVCLSVWVCAPMYACQCVCPVSTNKTLKYKSLVCQQWLVGGLTYVRIHRSFAWLRTTCQTFLHFRSEATGVKTTASLPQGQDNCKLSSTSTVRPRQQRPFWPFWLRRWQAFHTEATLVKTTASFPLLPQQVHSGKDNRGLGGKDYCEPSAVRPQGYKLQQAFLVGKRQAGLATSECSRRGEASPGAVKCVLTTACPLD